MPSAEIITIGTEILLGEITDTNARNIALTLRESGIDLYRKTTVGDNPTRIAQAINEAFTRCQIIITTGGLGPTVDDPTRDAVALAFGVETEFHPELWEQIQARFQRYNRQPTENNRRQAFLPHGALAIENPVGTAPAFRVAKEDKVIICLPGVPSEMQYLLNNSVLPYLLQKFQIKTILKTRTLHTAGVGESMIDERISNLETLTNPTVGLAAHSGQVDIRIVAKAESDEKAAQMIQPVEEELRARLGDWVYGLDNETLESVALGTLASRNWSLVIIEAGLGGQLASRLAGVGSFTFEAGLVLPTQPDGEELKTALDNLRAAHHAEVGLAVRIIPGSERQEVQILLVTPDSTEEFTRPYGGPPDYTPRWATHHSLDLIRRTRKDD